MTKTLAFMLSAALAACAGATDVRYGGGVVVRSPDLVTIEPDVYVVADADEPIFYTDNYYWLYRDGGWYRSNTYRGGWVRYYDTPYRLRRIDQPYAYVRYRDRGHRTTVRDQRIDGRYYDRTPNAPDRRYDQRYDRRYDQRDNDPYRNYPPGQVTPTRPEPPRGPMANPRPPQQQPPVTPNSPTTPDYRGNQPPHSDTPADVRDRDHDRGRPADQRDPGPPDRARPDRDRGPDHDVGNPNAGEPDARPTPPPDRGAPVDRGNSNRYDQDRGRGNDQANDRDDNANDRARGNAKDRTRRDKDEKQNKRDRDRDR
ncbi:MAG TPA: hypothetical protein VFQ53_21365 [Kofleriaceae bacterium]|nr:hypothetical protein [Kofleriaceae bacterium]